MSLSELEPHAAKAGSRPQVLLIHGFGASIGHWRHTIPSLAEQVEVHALDLLGFGGSDKPRSRLIDEPEQPDTVRYGFDLWGQQVVDYIQDQMAPCPPALEPLRGPAASDRGAAASGRSLHLVGNSIGAVVALNAASLLQRQSVRARVRSARVGRAGCVRGMDGPPRGCAGGGDKSTS